MARPRGTGKPPEEKFITRSIRFPPLLWAELEAQVAGEGSRSAFIREAIEKELRTRSRARSPRTEAERRAAVKAARGALAHVPASTDDFCREKQEEIDLEEARHARRWGGGA